jgi:hypothetical protein
MNIIEKASDLTNKFGENAINVVEELINEYENEICYCGCDNDWEMWNARQDYWKGVKQELSMSLERILFEIEQQATRKNRACDFKKYLITDLEIIEKLVNKAQAELKNDL